MSKKIIIPIAIFLLVFLVVFIYYKQQVKIDNAPKNTIIKNNQETKGFTEIKHSGGTDIE